MRNAHVWRGEAAISNVPGPATWQATAQTCGKHCVFEFLCVACKFTRRFMSFFDMTE